MSEKFTKEATVVRHGVDGDFHVDSADGGYGFATFWGQDDVAQANAQLFTSAEDLYYALKAAVDRINDLTIIIEQAQEMGLTLHICGDSYKPERARAALAKATGGNNAQ